MSVDLLKKGMKIGMDGMDVGAKRLYFCAERFSVICPECGSEIAMTRDTLLYCPAVDEEDHITAYCVKCDDNDHPSFGAIQIPVKLQMHIEVVGNPKMEEP